jgi:hypothetical protein
MTERHRVSVGSPAAQRIAERRLATIRRKAAEAQAQAKRAKWRKPDPVKLAARRAERRKAKGLDRHEPVGDEWER